MAPTMELSLVSEAGRASFGFVPARTSVLVHPPPRPTTLPPGGSDLDYDCPQEPSQSRRGRDPTQTRGPLWTGDRLRDLNSYI